MPTLRNTSSSPFSDLRRNAEREFTEEEMKSPDVQRALRSGRLIEIEDREASRDARSQQQRAKR